MRNPCRVATDLSHRCCTSYTGSEKQEYYQYLSENELKKNKTFKIFFFHQQCQDCCSDTHIDNLSLKSFLQILQNSPFLEISGKRKMWSSLSGRLLCQPLYLLHPIYTPTMSTFKKLGHILLSPFLLCL